MAWYQHRRTRAVPESLLGPAGLLLAAALVEVLPRAGLVPAEYLPPLSAMAGALAGEAGDAAFWRALRDTLTGWGAGLALATAAGVLLGLVIGRAEPLRRATASTIEFLRPIPSVALVPLAVLLHGTGPRATLLLVVYAAVWPVLLQVLAGVRDVDPVARDTAAVFRLPTLTRLRHLLWPTLLPYLMTGLRLAASVALILAVTAQLVIGSPGLGREIALAQAANAVERMYALVIVTGLLGVCVNAGARALERRVLFWHTSERTEAAA
ncbi:ABC transporter permease [Streptomyces marincola]|uniref:ABC transporter permease n=1 Tax=Streptomyces marincola TaxID=2878388 RepID=UPI001CF50F9E|nr:ABC transporter permease subunit [Streptomyces marincola]UCM87717.1 ABC transporter permease subunit [Streptomyces marincola]